VANPSDDQLHAEPIVQSQWTLSLPATHLPATHLPLPGHFPGEEQSPAEGHSTEDLLLGPVSAHQNSVGHWMDSLAVI
jgi:hypothetical protein